MISVPVEWLTLWMHMPFMLLFSDIRQGLFYSVLFSFWIIFTGEHLMVTPSLSNHADASDLLTGSVGAEQTGVVLEAPVGRGLWLHLSLCV